ncbi:hypothetical protein [Sporosarcina koreensis]|uniref:hypothetical protein n=1 Tax=Sporosarcina koreensis TaxID=334735 RepID=UPI00058B24E4|nr:hypothetical protein [Sporosarcina koreensis]
MWEDMGGVLGGELCPDADKFGEVSDMQPQMSDKSEQVADTSHEMSDNFRQKSDTALRAIRKGAGVVLNIPERKTNLSLIAEQWLIGRMVSIMEI